MMPHNHKRPLTQSQLLIWLGQQLAPTSPLYNVPYAFEVEGPLSPALFNEAFQLLLDRTDVLRTVFGEEEGQPYQTLIKDFRYTSEYIEVRDDKNFNIDKYLAKQSQLKFDYSQPLFKSVLVCTAKEKYTWFFMLHHLITDATSVDILFHQLSDIYVELKSGTIKEYEASSFEEFIDFEQNVRNTPQFEDLKEYWQNKLTEAITQPELYGRSSVEETTISKRVSTYLGKKRSDRLRGLSRQKEHRMFTDSMSLVNLFSTLYFIYLKKICRQDKIIFGSPVHNRNSAKFRNTAGLFIEVLPMMSEIETDRSFTELLQNNKQVFSEFLHYTDTGLASASISRSFNSVLNYIPWDFDLFAGMSSKARWIHPDHCDPAHILRCHVLDHRDGELELIFDLNASHFEEEEAQMILDHFTNLIDGILENPLVSLDDIPLISFTEKDKFLSKRGVALDPEFNWTVLERFRDIVSRYPDRVALECGTEQLDYRTLEKRVEQLAWILKNKGVVPGDKVGVYLYRSNEYIISVFAILQLGASFVPIASDLPPERVRYILNDSECRLCISDAKLRENLEIPKENILSIDQSRIWDTKFKPEFSATNGKDKIAYHLYTSGSTGRPKGVIIPMSSLQNYLSWASNYYAINEDSCFPLFTSTGFDLTISSTFLPLLNGGKLVVYREAGFGPDISLFRVFADNMVNVIKLTPSHLTLLQGRDLGSSAIRKMIVGGENFKTAIAGDIYAAMGKRVRIYNEYGPTEATVGCIAALYDENQHKNVSVPIGLPIANMNAYVMGPNARLLPQGVIGELYLSGKSVALGYQGLDLQTKDKFLPDPFEIGDTMYRTGDLARWDRNGELEFLGRIDDQVKLNGYRIELADIESNLTIHPDIENASVVVLSSEQDKREEVINCSQCGLPSNYPNTDFDENGVCHLCNTFDTYSAKVTGYFRDENELHKILTGGKKKSGSYDCLALLSGGKDSTYVLAKLVNMGLKVLAFTLDNGYISEQAKENIDRIVKKLDVDHIYGETPHMNKIFVDSLKRHQNVCNGCFKTIYTLSTKVALDMEIPFIVTGLSRGQFFETRLSEELFWERAYRPKTIDETILEARKLYHKEEDAIKQHLDVDMFEHEDTFDKVQFIDFYRYNDAPLSEMLIYLKEKVGWVRPTDTGRSTNCLINQVGIYVHKKEKGYSNYAFPYSWDVRLGHKTREESLEEINEVIYEDEVKRIMDEIGYVENDDSLDQYDKLVAYYVADTEMSHLELRRFLKNRLPDYMIPGIFKRMEGLPLTKNGKVDKLALENLNEAQLAMDTPYVAPRNEIEELLESIWSDVLQLKKVGVQDNFIALGGHSLAAIRITTRINEELQLSFPLSVIFDLPTIAEYASHIENTLVKLMEE